MIEEDCIGNYELENMLAILSCCVDEPKTKIIIGILSKPILWNKKKVQLVIIPLIGKNIGIKILDLYKELSYFADNSNYIKRIIKKQNQEEIIKIFNDIELENIGKRIGNLSILFLHFEKFHNKMEFIYIEFYNRGFIITYERYR